MLNNVTLFGHSRLPSFQSSEVTECGLACVAMVACFHGHDVDLNSLRQRYRVSLKGTTLADLMSIADDLGLSSRPLRVELADLLHVSAPAILHWDLNHFVVLATADKRGVVVHDPNTGTRRLRWDEVSNRFTGVVLELSPAANFAPVVAKAPLRLRSLWSRIAGVPSAAALIIGLSLASQLAAFAIPLQTQIVIDGSIARGESEALPILALAFGFLVLLQAALEALRNWSILLIGATFSINVVGNIVRHLLRLPADFFEKRHVGDILSRVSATAAIQDALTRGVVSSAIDGVIAVFAVLLMLMYSPRLTAVVVVSMAASVAVQWAYYGFARRRREAALRVAALEQSYLMESVRALTTIKLLGGEPLREGSWRNLFARSTQASLKYQETEVASTALQVAIGGLQAVVVIYLGAKLVLDRSQFTLGMLVAFLALRQLFADRFQSLIRQGMQFGMIGLHLSRLADIVTTPAEATDSQAQSLSGQGMQISLRNVSFSYGLGDRTILTDVTLDIGANEFVAVTGPSGGGKTTLFKLLLGLQSPTSGEVLLDGRRATSEAWRKWRQKVGTVVQSDQLFSGSLADNISFFDPGLDMERVVAAATAAAIHDDITQMPMQYASLIGDMGSALSAGQRQRLMLARALYRAPSILMLDEGTANLDPLLEEAIADRIAAMPMMRIVVAHRSALIERADRILRVEDGRVVESSQTPSLQQGAA